jgi:hypothetical protein
LRPGLSPRPITKAACWGHGRRKFFVLADVAKSAPGKKHGAPLALEAVRQIDAIFAIEREINGLLAEQRLAVRTTRIAPLVSELESCMRSERARLSRHADVAKVLKRWAAFTRFISDGRICLTKRALRGIAIGRKNWLFAGSDRGGERAVSMYTLIAPPSSTTSIRRPGSPRCCGALPTNPPAACTSCSPGTGTRRPPSTPPRNLSLIVTADCRRSCRLCAVSPRPRPDAYLLCSFLRISAPSCIQ